MADEILYPYYERELSFLTEMGKEFGAAHPRSASRLGLEAGASEDPHVERLIQAVAFLNARVQRKIEDEYPEITESLLNVLYPHYLAPVPSMSIVQFDLDEGQGKISSGFAIPQGAMLQSLPIDGAQCRFRTCYPTTLWPLKVELAACEIADSSRHGVLPSSAKGVIRLELRCLAGMALVELQLDQLRFYIHDETPKLPVSLYELIFNHVVEIPVRQLPGTQGSPVTKLPPSAIMPVGFAAEEGMLPYGPRSFLGYRLLQEYFSLPEKFLFFDLAGLSKVIKVGAADGFEIQLLLNEVPRLERPVTKDTFRLGCVPIVNLFDKPADPIRLSHQSTEYQVLADAQRQRAIEIYSINSVYSVTPGTDEKVFYQPFYSFKHAIERERQRAFWYGVRRSSPKDNDDGTDVFISLVDLDFRPTRPAGDTIIIHTTCSNRDLPNRLPFGGIGDEEKLQIFRLERAAPVKLVRCLKKPTKTQRVSLRRGVQWRVISHLSLNYLSLFEGQKEALQEILKLYDFAASNIVQQQIAGIVSVSGKPVVGRSSSMPREGFCRGLEVMVEFEIEKYEGGFFLFAAVLERFLGLYTSINSFVQLTAKTRHHEVKRWPPRAGDQILL